MKWVKRLAALLLALALAVGLCGCGLEALFEEEIWPLETTAASHSEATTGRETANSETTETTTAAATTVTTAAPTATQAAKLKEDGSYTSLDDVVRYLKEYGHLPSNFITKNEARALGWEGGSLEKYAPGKCIGGDRFGNYEGLLPTKKGRSYTECDIDTLGASSRGAKRLVFSNDGLYYYTSDHYEHFEPVGEETP